MLVWLIEFLNNYGCGLYKIKRFEVILIATIKTIFAMWKNNYFLKEHHITLDRGIAIALMSDERRIKLPNIYAPKTDTYFDGYLNLKIDGKKCRYSFSF